MQLTELQIERYSRQLLLQEVGGEGQQRLLSSKVLIIGAGGLGSPAGYYLAAAGVGTIGIVDSDAVDLSNLQRQIIHDHDRVGTLKVESAADRIRAINPDVNVNTYAKRVNESNIRSLIREYDFVIDGTDNFSAKFLINDACYFENKPFSHAGILRFQGQLMTILPGRSACYRCVFDAPPPPGSVPTCSQAGILGSVAGVIGSLQATEALKFILGKGRLLTDAILTFDALAMRFRKIGFQRNPDCLLCGKKSTITELHEAEEVSPVCDIKQGCCSGK